MPESYHINEDDQIIITNPNILGALDPISQRVVSHLKNSGKLIVQEADK